MLLVWVKAEANQSVIPDEPLEMVGRSFETMLPARFKRPERIVFPNGDIVYCWLPEPYPTPVDVETLIPIVMERCNQILVLYT